MSDRRLEAVVAGRVQGVGFRYWTAERATLLGLVGWVRNEDDGSVRLVAEGPDEALDRLERELHDGPAAARVDAVAATRLPATGEFVRFAIRSGGHAGD